MDANEITKKLTENGGKLWEKNEMKRIYFNAGTVLSLDINYYNTGNVSSATLDGIKISNCEAKRCLDLKFWYDLVDGKFHWKNADRLRSEATTTIDEFVAKMRAIIS